jgi:hypothetical protein
MVPVFSKVFNRQNYDAFDFYYDLLNTPTACGGVSTRKRGLGGNYVSPLL